jgi:hypothetical protein
MHVLVLHHSPWEPTRQLAVQVATELGCRVFPFDRRPDLAMYDLVVLGTSSIGLVDPQLGLYLASGELRGKSLALFADGLGPCITPMLQALGSAARIFGGTTVHAEMLATHTGLSGVQEGDRERARVWAHHLKTAYPAPTYPRGPAGKRSTDG